MSKIKKYFKENLEKFDFFLEKLTNLYFPGIYNLKIKAGIRLKMLAFVKFISEISP